MKENIDEIIKKMIGKCIEKKDEELLENFKNLKYDLGFSSINIMQLIYELEEKLGITLEGEVEIEKFYDYESLLQIVMNTYKEENDMNTSEIRGTIKSIFEEVLDEEIDFLNDGDYVFRDFNFESMDIMDLSFRIEEEFDISIEDDELWNLPGYIINKELLVNGKMNQEALALVKKEFELPEEEIVDLESPFELNDFITIGMLINYIEKSRGDRVICSCILVREQCL